MRNERDYGFNLNEHGETLRELFGEDIYTQWTNGDLDQESLTNISDEVQDLVEREQGELGSVCIVYGKADRIITRNSAVSVTLHKPTWEEPHLEGIAGWSDGKKITFNKDIVSLLSADDIPALNGLNYHELSHLLYTPRGGSEFVMWVQNNKLGMAFNYLEDARIETLMTARFPSTRLFLEANFMRYVAVDGTNCGSLFLLSRGRKYIPLAIRQEIADLFVAENGLEMATEVADIIDTYRTLVLPRDSEIAKPLIKRFAKIVGEGNMGKEGAGDGEGEDGDKTEEGSVGCPSDCTNREPMKYGRPLGVNEQSADSKKAKGSGKSEELREVDNTKLLEGEGDGENGIESDLVADGFMQQDTRKTERSLADLIEQRAKDIRSNDEVRREVREFREAVASNDEHRNTVRVARYTNMTPAEINKQNYVTGDYPLIAEQFGRELERLEIDNEPNWDKEKPSGRLNVQRTMNAGLNDIDRLFDQWSEVDYGTEIEAVILLDNSGSMGSQIQRASASVWAIKRGLERIHANTTVFSFNSGSRVLYTSDEKTSYDIVRTVHAGGTTNPVRALEEAKQIFNLTNRATKLLFIITDGGFDYAEPCDNLIKQFNEDGVITSTIFLGYIPASSYVWEADNIEGFRHYAKHFNVIADPADLVRVATDIVVEQLGVHQ
jgi:hypothetical protein